MREESLTPEITFLTSYYSIVSLRPCLLFLVVVVLFTSLNSCTTPEVFCSPPASFILNLTASVLNPR